MPFIINPKCKCCNDKLWHCWECWRDFHNGAKHNDYEPPEYYGQPMNEKIAKIMEERYGIVSSIKVDKKRKYAEGVYHKK